MSERIGVVGLGRMGGALADRLAGRGLAVAGWTRRGADPKAARAGGWRAVADLADLVAASDILILSLFDEAAVREVLDRIAGLDLRGKLVAETSTVSPKVVRDCDAAIRAAGGRLIDAPISGGPEMVEAGTIGIFIGGSAEDAARFLPVAQAASNRVAHVGPLGAGAAMKIVNNVSLAGAFEATAEALKLGQAMGLGFQTMLGVLAVSPSTTPVFKSRISKITGEDDEVGFPLEGAAKDADVFLGAGRDFGVALPVMEVAAAETRKAVAAGLGDKDVAARIRFKLGLP